MPLIHFQQQFAEAVADGTKRQTIRLKRKRPIKPGDTLFLGTWEGKPYRSKVRRLRTEICAEVEEITLRADGDFEVDGRVLGSIDRFVMARADGFSEPKEMLDWFLDTHSLPFHGVIIRW
jgi:hypothetical protein